MMEVGSDETRLQAIKPPPQMVGSAFIQGSGCRGICISMGPWKLLAGERLLFSRVAMWEEILMHTETALFCGSYAEWEQGHPPHPVTARNLRRRKDCTKREPSPPKPTSAFSA